MKSGMDKQTSRRKGNMLIALNTLFVIFGLAAGFTGTIAWFNSNRSFETTAGSFAIAAEPGVEFELYYLNYFHDGVDSSTSIGDGNWNTAIGEFSGYELDYENSMFSSVDDYKDPRVPAPEVSANPTSINHLWPAHKLTFVIAITQGSMSRLSIDSWSEMTSANSMIGANSYVRLSWAIDIYGKAYSAASIDAAWTSYYADLHSETPSDVPEDVFVFSQEGLTADEAKEYSSSDAITVISSVGSPAPSETMFAFITIEFSNKSTTFYAQSDASPHYYSKNSTGNSNCYESLSLTSLNLKIS